MPIEFICPHCSTTLRVPEEHAGKKAKCPNCQAVVPVELAPAQKMPPQNYADPQPGQPYASPAAPAYQSYGSPHRGGLILTMGILAIACNIFAVPGIVAWVMGRGDLRQMDAGIMDNEGRGITQAGMILGIIGTCLAILSFLIVIAYMMFIFLFVAAAAAGAG